MKRALILFLIVILLPANALARETFPPSSLPVYTGIDVSAWQGEIDFAAVRDFGVEIVYIRASEGESFTDPYFERNYAAARAAGLKVGFYHFATARSEQEAVAQAEFFCSLLTDKTYEGRPALDFGDAQGLSGETLSQLARTFLETVQTRTGHRGALYTDAYAARERYAAYLNVYPLWVANYGVTEPEANGKWASWAGFQYSDRGRVDGITGNVDRDHFTKEMLLDSPAPTPTPAPTAPPREGVRYAALRPGETLADIAARYGTTQARLEQDNFIPSGGAQAGQLLRILSGAVAQDGRSASVFLAPGNSTVYYTALHFGLTGAQIRAHNALPDPARIFSGQAVYLPALTNRETLISSPDTLLENGYVVTAGDTLASVAARFDLTPSQLAAHNGLEEDAAIYPGQILHLSPFGVPAGQTDFYGAYVVQRGDTLSRIARRFGVTADALFEANDIRNRNLLVLGQVLVIPSAGGR